MESGELSALVDDEWDTGQSQMKVRRPAGRSSALRHHVETHSVHQGEILIGEAAEDLGCPREILLAGSQDLQEPHVLDHRQELQRSRAVVALEEPAVTFGHDSAVVRSGGGSANRRRKSRW